jgi:hypothetical protein
MSSNPSTEKKKKKKKAGGKTPSSQRHSGKAQGREGVWWKSTRLFLAPLCTGIAAEVREMAIDQG